LSKVGGQILPTGHCCPITLIKDIIYFRFQGTAAVRSEKGKERKRKRKKKEKEKEEKTERKRKRKEKVRQKVTQKVRHEAGADGLKPSSPASRGTKEII
jgi:hypothetical protein